MSSSNNLKKEVEIKRHRFLQEMRAKMYQHLVVDTFMLVGLVIKARIGTVRLHDRSFDILIRNKHLQICVFSWIGLVATIVMGVLLTRTVGDSVVPITVSEAFEDSMLKAEVVVLQFIITLTSLVACILIAQKYQLLIYERRKLWSGISTYDLVQHGDNNPELVHKFEDSYIFWRSGLRWRLLAELAIHIFHPFVSWNNTDTATLFAVLQSLVFARMYLGIRAVFLFSQEFKARNDIVSSNKELQRTGFEVRVRSTMKMLFFKYPIGFTVALMLSTMLPFGYIIYLLERQAQPDAVSGFGRVESAYWFAFETFSTLGYGELVTQTVLGRFVAIVCGSIGITITTVFGGIVTNLMVQSKEQRHVSEYLGIVQNTKGCRHAAARTIQAAWRFHQTQRKVIVDKWAPSGHKSNTLFRAIREFRRFRWELSQSQSTASDPVIDAKIDHVSNRLSRTVELVRSHNVKSEATFNLLDAFLDEAQRQLDVYGRTGTTRGRAGGFSLADDAGL